MGTLLHTWRTNGGRIKRYSRPRLTVFRQYSETIQAQVSSALAGDKTVKQALDDASCQVIDLFTQAGYYKALGVDPYQKQPQCKH